MITETRMINLSAKKRLAIFLSCGWIILFVIYAIRRASDGFPWSAEFLGFGISPLFIIWGIYWVISGFKRDKSKSEPLSALLKTKNQSFQLRKNMKSQSFRIEKNMNNGKLKELEISEQNWIGINMTKVNIKTRMMMKYIINHH